MKILFDIKLFNTSMIHNHVILRMYNVKYTSKSYTKRHINTNITKKIN